MDCSPPGSSVHRDSPGKDTEVGCHAVLQEIFPAQGSNPGLQHYGGGGNSLLSEPLQKCMNTGEGSLSLLQGIIPIQESNWSLRPCRWILYQLSYQGSPKLLYIWDCISLPLASVQFNSVQSLSRVWLFATPWIAACQASLSITNSHSLLRFMFIESVMPSSHLILCHPLLLLPPIPPSIRVFSNESTLRMRWPKYSFQRNPRADLLQNGLSGSPCSPRDSQESSPTPQFKSIHSLVRSFLHSPTLTSIHDHGKNHSLD